MESLAIISVEQIDTSGRIRNPAPEQVEALRQSILTIGLLNPITVCRLGDESFKLVAGGNRLEAFKAAGFNEIPANVVGLTAPEAIIAECDENLCGPNLSPAERALFTARRKEAYEEIHPEAKAGTAGAIASNTVQGNATDKLSTASFATETAKTTGKDERTVRRDAERGEKVIPEALDMVKGTKLDTGVYLDKLKKLKPNEQVHAVKRDLAIEKQSKTPAADDFDPMAIHSSRQTISENFSEDMQSMLAARDTAKTSKAPSVEQLQARIEELEESQRILEADYASVLAENKSFEAMRVQFEKGGVSEVIAGKDEQIRVLEARVYSESEDAAKWFRKYNFWKDQAKKLGWRNERSEGQTEALPEDDAFYAVVNGE